MLFREAKEVVTFCNYAIFNVPNQQDVHLKTAESQSATWRWNIWTTSFDNVVFDHE